MRTPHKACICDLSHKIHICLCCICLHSQAWQKWLIACLQSCLACRLLADLPCPLALIDQTGYKQLTLSNPWFGRLGGKSEAAYKNSGQKRSPPPQRRASCQERRPGPAFSKPCNLHKRSKGSMSGKICRGRRPAAPAAGPSP